MTHRVRTALLVMLFSVILCGAAPAGAQTKRGQSLQSQVAALQSTVKTLTEHQRDLEARIAVLERLNLAPSPQMVRESYIRSSRDAIINDIANLSANAYQYRIRPTTMGGGGGSYLGYSIPKRLAASDNAILEVTVFQDSAIFKGSWSRGTGTVQCEVGREGRMGKWIYTGDFE